MVRNCTFLWSMIDICIFRILILLCNICSVDIICNECNDDADCNLNGVCKKDRTCECYDDVEGVTFIGPHCEVRLRDECYQIYGELYNDTWSVISLPWDNGLWTEYDRPVYIYQEGNPLVNETDALLLLYSGDRWMGFYQPGGQYLFTEDYKGFLEAAATNYHGEYPSVTSI